MTNAKPRFTANQQEELTALVGPYGTISFDKVENYKDTEEQSAAIETEEAGALFAYKIKRNDGTVDFKLETNDGRMHDFDSFTRLKQKLRAEISTGKEPVDISDLSAEVADGESRHYDFSTGYPSDWEVAFRQTEEERMNERFMPMMNSLWPLPDNYEPMEEDKDAMDNMTVVAVKEGSGYPDYYLALTGGGMDMSWQIGRTYVNLGYLPPAALGDLPRMAGMDFDKPRNRKVIEALKKSHEVNKNSSDYSIRKLEEL